MIIGFADAVVEPFVMMVEFVTASVALHAVFRMVLSCLLTNMTLVLINALYLNFMHLHKFGIESIVIHNRICRVSDGCKITKVEDEYKSNYVYT